MLNLLAEWIGPAQIAALITLAQRGGEELVSMRNTAALKARGAHEEGAEYYPVVAAAHLGWIAAIFFLVPVNASVLWPLLTLYVVVQVARYWTLSTIGSYWTHRIITLPDAPLVKRGVYSMVRHPNYLITRIETLLLPCVFGAWALGIIFAAIWWCVLEYKIKLEDAALAGRTA